MNSSNALNNVFITERELFLKNLASFTLVDVGIIKSVLNGRAQVSTNQYVAGKRVEYDDVEIVYPGNSKGAFQVEATGCACLIFVPCTCTPNILERSVVPSALPYGRDGIKVMPIGNGVETEISCLLDSSGNYSILTDSYQLLFSPESISLVQGDVLRIFKDIDGSCALRYKEPNAGVFNLLLDGTGVHQEYECDNVTWVDDLNKDGTRVLKQMKGDTEQCSVSIDADGNVSITGKELHFNGSDHHLVSWEELNNAMQKLYTALTTTPIAGNGSPQPTWTGITSIDISAAKTATLLTDD